MTFGRYIQARRREKGINQRKLASDIGIDVTYLSKIENGRLPPPSHDTIVKLAQELDEDADKLLILANKMPQDLKEIIMKSPARPNFLRSVSDLSDKDLERLQEYAETLRNKRT